MNRAKYGNIKTVVDGLKFDSLAEAARWGELQLMLRAGLITDLRRQVQIALAPGVKLHGATRARPPIRLIVDFCYLENGERVWEDKKGGPETPLSLTKRHLAKALHNIDVRIV